MVTYYGTSLPKNHVLLEMPSGLTLQGAPFADVDHHLGRSIMGVQPTVSWNALVGPQESLRITPRKLRDAVRRWFDGEEVLVRAAHLLSLLGTHKTLATERGLVLARLALGDSWPAKVVQSDKFIDAAIASRRTVFTMNEHGLLWLLLDALRDPWKRAESALAGVVADQRFARLVLIASDGFGLSLTDQPAPPGPSLSAERGPFTTAKALLPAARLGERDDARRLLVRSYELYAEILPTRMPAALLHFRAARGMEMRDWIVASVSLANNTERAATGDAPPRPILDLNTGEERPSNGVVDFIESIARPIEHFSKRITALLPNLEPHELPAQAIRESPILRLDDRRFLVLHDDWVMTQADDGVLYAFLETLDERQKGSLLEALGASIETYAERVLTRCVDVPGVGGTLARVKRAEQGNKRCDYVWLLEGRSIFIETKRVGLGAIHLHGRDELGKRLAKELGEACRQILETRRALLRDKPEDICPDLAGMTIPATSVALIVTQRPIFAWYSTRREIIPPDLRNEWAAAFGSPPMVLSLSELELLEAALPTVGIKRIFDAIKVDEVETYAGLAEFLLRIRYRGAIRSPYYDERLAEIIRARD